MMLCIAMAGTITALSASHFTLSWTHSVEHTRWEEFWTIEDGRLRLLSARVQGSGAGIGLPDDAVWTEQGWTWTPTLPPLRTLSLAASGRTGEGWMLCTEKHCLSLGERLGETVMLSARMACDQ
jgi:hypothetical protein